MIGGRLASICGPRENRLSDGGPCLAIENPASRCFGNIKLASLIATRRAVPSVPIVVCHPGCGADKATGTTSRVITLLPRADDSATYPGPGTSPAADGLEAPGGNEISIVIFQTPSVLPAPFSTVYR